MAKDLIGFEGLYKIDELGNLFTFKKGRGTLPEGSKLVQSLNTKGYPQVRIYDSKGKGHTLRVHRLVAQSFIPNPENLPQVDHIDGDKTNNMVSNLRWVTNQTNTEKELAKVYYLLHKDGTGYFIKNFTKWCRQMNFSQASFYRMMNGERKSAHGFKPMEAAYSS